MNETKKKEESKVKKKEIKKKIKPQVLAAGITFIVVVAGIAAGFAIYMNVPKGGTLAVSIFKWWVDEEAEEILDFGGDPFDINEAFYSQGLIPDPLFATHTNPNGGQSSYNEIICQITEGLFAYDYSDPKQKIIPNLAISHDWNDDGTELTCTLRQGVTFHDGTPFNATAVKWNFDRLYSMIDWISASYLYQYYDGTNIVNETQIIDTYTVKFVLNRPYVPLLSVLCYPSSFMLSPTSTPIPVCDKVEDLVGTGPFIYESFHAAGGVSESSVLKFSPNPSYWGGKPAVDSLEFHYNTDVYSTYFLNGTHHINTFAWQSHIVGIHEPGFLNEFSEAGFIINESPVTAVYYVGMNNKQIPIPMRKAISYAIDYDYIIEEFYSNAVDRPRSFIPECIMYSNWEDYDLPVLNLEIARQTLIDSGLYENLPEIDDDATWEDLAANNPIAIYNYSYTGGELLPHLLQDNLAKIGIKVTAVNLTFFDVVLRGMERWGFHRDMLQLFPAGFGFDINDPYEICNGLFSEASYWNWGQFEDPQVQQWVNEALGETDPVAREALYENIQQRVIEELYPFAWTYVKKTFQSWATNVRGYFPNGKNIYEFKNAYLV